MHEQKRVSHKDLACLNGWPEGTKGFLEEEWVLETLNALCKSFGYGRVPQLAKHLEEIWRDPAAVARHEELRRRHLKMLAECTRIEGGAHE